MFYRRSDMSVTQPLVYDIRVAGVVDPAFSDYVRGMTITPDTASTEGPVTIVRGTCPDHSAFVGVLSTLGTLGFAVMSVRCLGAPNGTSVDQAMFAEGVGAGAQAEDAQGLEPAAAAAGGVTVVGGVAVVGVRFSDKALAPFRKGGVGRIGAGTGLLVGGLLSAGGPPCMLVGAISGAIIGGLAASLMGKTLKAKPSEG